jgi:DUF4097 and DUF4098 domain-containing protein YvlB
MSDQEMMYRPPEQSSQEPPRMPLNSEPQEQSEARQPYSEQPYESASYNEGYRGASPSYMQGEKITPARKVTLDMWQLILLLFVAFLVGAGLGGSLFSGFIGFLLGVVVLAAVFLMVAKVGFGKAMPIMPHSFLVTGVPTLVVRNPAGAINIHRGSTNEVQVQGIKHVTTIFGNRQDLSVEFAQEGNTIRVSAEGFGNSPNISLTSLGHVDLDITVPEFCDVQVDGSAGTIQVTGVRGKANLKTSAGTITIIDSALEDARLSTNAGTLHFERTELRGQANIETNAGTIYFEGSVEPGGDYRLHTNAGTIHASLPASSSFILNTHTDMGTVQNDFGSNVVGSEPQARLDLRTNLGTIHVERRG